tara:strand:- start:400 stop:894 length:495 start_codon:yes stop_codon:yes gene_type:complete
MIMKITVNAVKTFIGREGEGYNCNVFVDGAKVAFARDDAGGGMTDYDYVGKAHETRQANYSLLAKAIKEYPPTRIENEKIECLKSIYDKDGNCAQGIDSIIGGAVNSFLINRKRKSQLKTKVLYIDNTCKDGEYFTIPHKGNAEKCRAYILAKYKNVEFLEAVI